jgi:hypothetical protein
MEGETMSLTLKELFDEYVLTGKKGGTLRLLTKDHVDEFMKNRRIEYPNITDEQAKKATQRLYEYVEMVNEMLIHLSEGDEDLTRWLKELTSPK